jgi:uncharacterized protein (TIGR00297 family)
VLGYLAGSAVWQLVAAEGHAHADLAKALAVSVFFALAAWRLKAATAAAAWCGGMICLLVIESYQRIEITTMNPHRPEPSIAHSGLAPLIVLFALTFEATRLGRAKELAGDRDEGRTGRNAAQIIANLGVAGVMATRFGAGGWAFSGQPESFVWFSAIFNLTTLAALCEATADTVASEIGQAFGGRPFLLTTFRRVEPGTDGAITPLGTFAGIAAAAMVAFSGAPSMGMTYAECGVALAAGVAGLFFDSLLGATLERKGWMGNDLVNFSSTAFAALVSLVVRPLL